MILTDEITRREGLAYSLSTTRQIDFLNNFERVPGPLKPYVAAHSPEVAAALWNCARKMLEFKSVVASRSTVADWDACVQDMEKAISALSRALGIGEEK